MTFWPNRITSRASSGNTTSWKERTLADLADAMAHCTPQMQADWTKALAERGIVVPNYLIKRKVFRLSAYWGTNAEKLALTLSMA